MASFTTPKGVLSFPVLHEPRPRSEGGEPVFSSALLFDEDAQKHDLFRALSDEVNRLAKELAASKKITIDKVRLPFLDAAEKADKYQGYRAGVKYINPWTKNKPQVVDPGRQPILDANDIYAGQWARFNVSPFSWARSGKYGISLGLNAVQVLKMDAPRIDGRANAASIFDDGEGAKYSSAEAEGVF